MLKILTIYCLSLAGPSGLAQMGVIDLNRLAIESSSEWNTKSDLDAVYGEGYSMKVHFDCGPFSEEWQEETFQRIAYPWFSFLGNEQSGYTLEEFDFQGAREMVTYGSDTLSGTTTVEAFCKIFQITFQQATPQDCTLVLLSEQSDYGGTFTFKDGFLASYKFFSGC